MLSELLKTLLEESDFESQTTLAKSAFRSDDRKYLDFTNNQLNAKSAMMQRLNILFETLVGDITVAEIVAAMEYTKKIKKGSQNDIL